MWGEEGEREGKSADAEESLGRERAGPGTVRNSNGEEQGAGQDRDQESLCEDPPFPKDRVIAGVWKSQELVASEDCCDCWADKQGHLGEFTVEETTESNMAEGIKTLRL